MKIPSSCGQAWTFEQWEAFQTFLKTKRHVSCQINLPKNAKNWPMNHLGRNCIMNI